MTPMPPAWAMAMAIGASVTVSMADERIGQVELDVARHAGADIGVARQDGGARRLQKDVVEGQRFFAGDRCDDPGQGQTLSAQKEYQLCGVGPPVEESGGHGVGTGHYHAAPGLQRLRGADSGQLGATVTA